MEAECDGRSAQHIEFAIQTALMSTKQGFYAVANGRSPGVFFTWGECEAQVKGQEPHVKERVPTVIYHDFKT